MLFVNTLCQQNEPTPREAALFSCCFTNARQRFKSISLCWKPGWVMCEGLASIHCTSPFVLSVLVTTLLLLPARLISPHMQAHMGMQRLSLPSLLFRSQLVSLLHLERSMVTGDIMCVRGRRGRCPCRRERDGEGVIDCEINWKEWRGDEMERLRTDLCRHPGRGDTINIKMRG